MGGGNAVQPVADFCHTLDWAKSGSEHACAVPEASAMRDAKAAIPAEDRVWNKRW